jgi:hypothetical protein
MLADHEKAIHLLRKHTLPNGKRADVSIRAFDIR